jgi:L-seryl-tRNA(Ser) seleniumtransferase
VNENQATVGGGSLPGESMPSFVLEIRMKSPDQFLKKLREQNPPIIARIDNDKILFDPRALLPEQDSLLLSILHRLLPEFK